MKFVATIAYDQDHGRRDAASAAHRAYLRGLLDNGRLFAAGPYAADAGAVWIYEAETNSDAEQVLRDDPFYDAGVFASWQIRPLAYWSAKPHKGP